MLKFLIGLVFASVLTTAFADNAIIGDKLYMKLDSEIGGYITLETVKCEIESKKQEYSYKAVIENGKGDTRRACWYRAEPPDSNHIPLVIVLEEITYQGKVGYNIGSFGQYYFKPTKD